MQKVNIGFLKGDFMLKGGISQWLDRECQRKRLSLREAGELTGLSHSTIQAIIKGGNASAETVRRLAHAFSGNGNKGLNLEDYLMVLAGHRTKREEGGLSQPVARLVDKLSQFSEPQLKLVEHFAEYLASLEVDNEGR